MKFPLTCAYSLLVSMLYSFGAYAFESGSTGADGAFSPSSDVVVALPEDGILNYTSFDIPSGVAVSFSPNQANTPVYILVQGDATIAGTLDLNGVDGGEFGRIPPGAYAGGKPQLGNRPGGNGKGPGGGFGGDVDQGWSSAVGYYACGGTGAGYASAGLNPSTSYCTNQPIGQAYGDAALQLLLGGSGGGAGESPDTQLYGRSGGSGGGAILLAVSGTLSISGNVLAVGGAGEDGTYTGSASTSLGSGGGGSGGGVRLVASTLSGAGVIDVRGGAGGVSNSSAYLGGGDGGAGRIRLEGDVITFSGEVKPNASASVGAPRPVLISELPSIRITSIAGRAVSANPIGDGDVVLPSNVSNPVTVEIAASGVPVNSDVYLTVNPETGDSGTTVSGTLSGTETDSTASLQVSLSQGASTLLVSVAYNVNEAQSASLTRYTDGEPVEKVHLATTADGRSHARLVTRTGRIFEMPVYN